MGKGTEVVIDLAKLLAAQLESGEKSAAVVPATLAHIGAARKLSAMALKLMAQPRDFVQRKIYALLRVSWAIARMGRAETSTEKVR